MRTHKGTNMNYRNEYKKQETKNETKNEKILMHAFTYSNVL